MREENTSIRSIEKFLVALDQIGVEWSNLPRDTRSKLETALVEISTTVNNEQDFQELLKTGNLLDWRTGKAKSAFDIVFRDGRNPLSAEKLQVRLLKYINEFGAAKLFWPSIPEDMKQSILQGIEKEMPNSREFAKLFSG
jgi:hypothetical protein